MSSRPRIAVIGMGCRFPGADGTEEFWRLLCESVDVISGVPADRWDADALWSSDPAEPGRTYCRWGGFMEQGDWFDAALFGISENEAEHMDPQQGLVLEVAWQALENAGIAPRSLSGSETGVFVGISNNDFDRKLCRDLVNLDLRAGTGTSYSIVANRISYMLGLRGPSFALDAACASSLATIHLACQSLWLHECDLALAGGTHLVLSPEKTVTFSCGGLLSRRGRCQSLSDEADGYVRGDGCGMVVLKRLDEAKADGNSIWAVICGSAVNHNGTSNGLSAPLGAAQQHVIHRALESGKIQPASIGYVEAHSPGTPLGDAIEFKALQAVLSTGRSPDQTCIVGSVKSNLGHLEAAAGVAGVIKAVLSISRGWIPATLHVRSINRHIHLAGTPFRIADQPMPWPSSNRPRRCAVSAFSFGGANAHIVIEEAPTVGPEVRQQPTPDEALWLLPVTAASPEALETLAVRYAAYCDEIAAQGDRGMRFADMCFTAALGRTPLEHRLAVLARDATEAAALLRDFVAEGHGPGIFVDRARRRAPVAVIYGSGPFTVSRRALPSGWAERWQALLSEAREAVAACRPFDDAAGCARASELLAATALLSQWGIRVAAVSGEDATGKWVAHALSGGSSRTSAALRLKRCPILGEAATPAGLVAISFGAITSALPLPAARVLSLDGSGSERSGFPAALAMAYVTGTAPDWTVLYGGMHRQLRSMPTYPFERRRHWRLPPPADRVSPRSTTEPGTAARDW
jgi:acyl transferase domain-containing protein